MSEGRKYTAEEAAEKIIQEYPEQCKDLTPETFLYKLRHLAKWIEPNPDSEYWKTRSFEDYPFKKEWEYVEAIEAKLKNPNLDMTEEFPNALSLLQYIDERGHLRNSESLNISRKAEFNYMEPLFTEEEGTAQWKKAETIKKKSPKTGQIEAKDVITNKLAALRKKIAHNIDKALGTNLEEKKLAKPLKKIEKAISDKLFGKVKE